MAADAESTKPNAAPFLTLPKLLVLLALTIAATAAVVYFALRGSGASNEQVVTVLDAREAADARVNTGEVLDATVPSNFQPEIGRRYRVRISGESRDGASMIAHIGNTVTFVKGGQVGEIVDVEVTRLHRTTAEAIVLNRAAPRESAPAPQPRAPTTALEPAPAGEIYTGVVVRVGRLGDGLVKLGEQSVYIAGAQKGERVVFEIIDKRERFWSGRLLRKLAAEESGRPRSAPDDADERAPHVQPGAEFEVVVRERERRNPEKDGVARIDGVAVLIPDCKPGDRLRIRIVERRPTLAKAEILERLPPDAN
jgi:predicted RNA-binding protein with TRAM domain